jgi:hypothetical protein
MPIPLLREEKNMSNLPTGNKFTVKQKGGNNSIPYIN